MIFISLCLPPNSSLDPRKLAAQAPASSPPTVLKGREQGAPGSSPQSAKHFPAVPSRQIGTYHVATRSLACLHRELGKRTPGEKWNVTTDLTQAQLSSFRWPAAIEEGRGDLPSGGNKVHLPRLPSLLWLPGFLARKRDEQVSRPGLSWWVSLQLLVLHEANAR